MKKSLSTILALTLCLAMAVPAFAKEINQDSDSKSGDTPVSFTVTPTYTVKIPETVELEQKTANGTVTYEKDATLDYTVTVGNSTTPPSQVELRSQDLAPALRSRPAPCTLRHPIPSMPAYRIFLIKRRFPCRRILILKISRRKYSLCSPVKRCLWNCAAITA